MRTRGKPKSGTHNRQDGQFRQWGWPYKQSQFPGGPEMGADRWGVAPPYSAKRTQFGPGGCRDWRDQSCKTKPICHSSTGRGAGGKKRKSPSGRGQMRQTNPIGTGAASKASPVWTRNYGELSMQRRPAKQSQFPTDGAGRPSPRPEALTLPPAGRQSCETKPNLGRMGHLEDGAPAGVNRATSPRCPASGNKANWEKFEV
jgi:hypothetical protein